MSKIYAIFHEKDGIFLSYKKEPKCLKMFCNYILIHTYKCSSALFNNERVLHCLRCAMDTEFFFFFSSLLVGLWKSLQCQAKCIELWSQRMNNESHTLYHNPTLDLWPRKTVHRIPSNTLHLTVTVPPITGI